MSDTFENCGDCGTSVECESKGKCQLQSSLASSESSARRVWVGISQVNGCALMVEDEQPDLEKEWHGVTWTPFTQEQNPRYMPPERSESSDC